MTEDKLKRGQKLLEDIEKFTDELEKWNNANDFHKIELSGGGSYPDYNTLYEVSLHFMNFKDVKLLAIAKLEDKIDKLQNEFDKL